MNQPTPQLASASLNPAQAEIQETLGAPADQRPTFDKGLRNHLRDQLENGFVECLHDKIELPIFLAKHTLNLLHGCEARFIAEQNEPFSWSVPIARGMVAHKAIELHLGRRGNPTPLDLVEDAVARLEAEQRSISTFLQEMNEADRAQLTSDANEVVATFFETFPPIKRTWRPVCESRVRADFCEANITLSGKVDLTLGQANGMTAGKVLFDLKTGKAHHSHVEDLRFYALLETLKVGTPPRLLVNYYLESGTPQFEAVTEDLLFSTALRVVDGLRTFVELRESDARQPVESPGINCRWCPAKETCEPGQLHLRQQDEAFDNVYP